MVRNMEIELIDENEILTGRRKEKYNETNTCDRCGNDLIPTKATREYKEENWTGKWICNICYLHDYNEYHKDDRRNYTKETYISRRKGILNPNSNAAKGDRAEELTSKWRGVKVLSKELDHYELPYDHSMDPELGVIQTKSKLYDPYNKSWSARWKNEHDKIFDYLIYYCLSSDGTVVERIYIFPNNEVVKRSGISIYSHSLNIGRGSKLAWYEEYRVKDDNIMMCVNHLWKEIIENRKFYDK